jgi:hypothetical protein
MSKMGLHDPFGHLKHKLWPKEGSGVKLVNLDKDYNVASNFILIEGLHKKLWAPKVTIKPTLGISGLPLGSPGTKWHFGVGPVARYIIYYKGEGGGFPQVWVVVSFVSPCLHVACPNTKSTQTCCLVWACSCE